MKRNLRLITVLVVVILGIAIYLRTRDASGPTTEPSQIEQVKLDDINRLEAKGDEQEKAKSLRRMAFQNPDKAMAYTRQLVSDPSPILRAAAYETAGGFSGESWEKLIRDGLADADVSVRLATLKGLNRQPSSSRMEMVRAYLNKGTRDHNEKAWALMALMRASADQGERAAYEKEVLIQLPKVEQGNLEEILLELYKIWPDRKELFPYAQKIVSAGGSTQALMPSFRYLQSYAAENLAASLSKASWPPSRSFLLSVIKLVSEKCPPESSELVRKIESHEKTDDDVREQIKILKESDRCVLK